MTMTMAVTTAMATMAVTTSSDDSPDYMPFRIRPSVSVAARRVTDANSAAGSSLGGTQICTGSHGSPGIGAPNGSIHRRFVPSTIRVRLTATRPGARRSLNHQAIPHQHSDLHERERDHQDEREHHRELHDRAPGLYPNQEAEGAAWLLRKP